MSQNYQKISSILFNRILSKTCFTSTPKHLQNYNNKILKQNIYTSVNLYAKVSFKLSDIGEGIREVVVKEWFVKEGDTVSQFDNICEVQSDKASVTITSRYDGKITKLHYNIDDIALVGKPLIDLETEDNSAPSEPISEVADPVPIPEVQINAQIPQKSIKIGENSERLHTNSSVMEMLCIPSVRRLAKQNNIDLTKLQGSGKGGRILKEDILEYLNKESQSSRVISTTEDNIIKDIKSSEAIKGFRKAMVKTMTEALKIPHFVYSDEIKVTKISQLRKELKRLTDTKITFMPFFIKAASNSLKRYPIINSSVDEHCENIIYHEHHNIGIAMDTTAGLAVPVIKNVEQLSILEIVREMNRLRKLGKNGNFSPTDLSGGTFAISNIGIVGGTYTKPVILPPQVAIIALGISQLLPRFDEQGAVIAEEIVNVSASADHRVIDGVTMAKFINCIKRQIENPNLLFLDL